MTTSRKQRYTIWTAQPSELEALYDLVRELAPIEKRGRCTRSTITEAAVSVALRDVQARGRDSDVYRAMVTLPRCQLCGSEAAMVAHPGGDIWYCPTCGDGDYVAVPE